MFRQGCASTLYCKPVVSLAQTHLPPSTPDPQLLPQPVRIPGRKVRDGGCRTKVFCVLQLNVPQTPTREWDGGGWAPPSQHYLINRPVVSATAAVKRPLSRARQCMVRDLIYCCRVWTSKCSGTTLLGHVREGRETGGGRRGVSVNPGVRSVRRRPRGLTVPLRGGTTSILGSELGMLNVHRAECYGDENPGGRLRGPWTRSVRLIR